MTNRLPRFDAGERVTSLRNKLNTIVDRVNRDIVSQGATGPAPGLPPVPIMRLQIRNLVDTTPPALLECTLPGQELNPSAQTWFVIIPSTFTESSRAGVSYVYSDINTRVADSTENQKLTPIYIINDLVYVATIAADGIYLDINVDGRQWAAVP